MKLLPFICSFYNLLVQSFLNFQCRVGCFVKMIRNDQRQNIVSIPPIVVTPLTVVIRMKGFDRYSQTQRAEDSSLGRIQAAPLSWLNFVTSHSSWEALKIKSSTTKVDYNSDLLSNLDRQATIHDLKARVRMFKNMGGNNPGGNLLGGNFPGGVWWVEIFPVGASLIPYLINCEVIL